MGMIILIPKGWSPNLPKIVSKNFMLIQQFDKGKLYL